MNTVLRILLMPALLLLVSCNDGPDLATLAHDSAAPPATATPDYWPTAGWQSADPAAHGFQPGAFDTLAADAAAALPYYTSLLVIKDGWILHESYHDTATETGNNADTLHHVWSVTKSVTSLVLGRAWTLGELPLPAASTATDVLDVRAEEVLPANLVSTLPAGDHRRNISLRDLLLMRSGYAWNEKDWLLQPTKDPVISIFYGLAPPNCPNDAYLIPCAIINRPLAYEPGTTWNYSTYDSYLISAFFTGLTGQRLADYGKARLFDPIGMSVQTGDWYSLPSFYTYGGGLLYIRSRDLARLGMLMLYGGQWDGAQLLAPEWMAKIEAAQGTGSMAAFDSSGEPAAAVTGNIPYGMQWWLRTGPDGSNGSAISARGLFGQQMHLYRDRGLIILITCDSDRSDLSDRNGAINDFLKTHVLDRLNP